MGKKPGYPTPFQRAFFDQLEALKAASRGDLIEQARQQGIPRECAEAFWWTKQQEAKRPLQKEAGGKSFREPKPAA